MKIDANDPKWTAYALGEITDEKERAEIENAIKESAELHELVEDIRQMAVLLKQELKAEPAARLTSDQRKRIETKANAATNWFMWKPAWAMAAGAVILAVVSYAIVRQLKHEGEIPPKDQITLNAPQIPAPEQTRETAIPVPSKTLASPDREVKTRAREKAEKAAPLVTERPIVATPPAIPMAPDAIAIASPPIAYPHGSTSLGGIVVDASQAVLPGATITATNPLTGLTAKTTANNVGVYSFNSLAPGVYQVAADMKGFQPATKNDFKLGMGSTARLNFELAVAGVSTEIAVVSAASNMLLESSSSAGALLSENKVAELPLASTDAKDLINVMGGVVKAENPIFGNNAQTFAGVKAENLNITRDGITVNDTRYNSGVVSPGRISPDLVGEFKMVLTPVDAEMARGAGHRKGKKGHVEYNTEAYANINDNPFMDALQNPLSTFSIDVDTASYSNVRRFLDDGKRPPKDAVRIEELVNYFDYSYKAPQDGKPFAANFELTEAPWNPEHKLLRVGLKGREIAPGKRPDSNLVFLLDVSGSMEDYNKLPLVKQSMLLLLDQLMEADKVAIVVYASDTRVVLASTRGDQKDKIRYAINSLRAGGSTNGASGLQLAYQIAKDNFIKGGVNRVILATDGDFNVGITSQGDLTRLIEEKANSGIYLSAMGFGMGNLKDSTLELLADKGRGNYAYIDDINEAKKVFVDQINATLVAIAKDVKIQVEFNPQHVSSYRLIGYEDRVMAKEDFNNDAKKAGVIGAGHTVTALYELVPAGSSERLVVDPLKYQKAPQPSSNVNPNELLAIKIRSKEPEKDISVLSEFVVQDSKEKFKNASRDFKFAAAVAVFGMSLRESPYKGTADLEKALEWAKEGKGSDPKGYRQDFIRLIHRAISLKD